MCVCVCVCVCVTCVSGISFLCVIVFNFVGVFLCFFLQYYAITDNSIVKHYACQKISQVFSIIISSIMYVEG